MLAPSHASFQGSVLSHSIEIMLISLNDQQISLCELFAYLGCIFRASLFRRVRALCLKSDRSISWVTEQQIIGFSIKASLHMLEWRLSTESRSKTINKIVN